MSRAAFLAQFRLAKRDYGTCRWWALYLGEPIEIPVQFRGMQTYRLVFPTRRAVLEALNAHYDNVEIQAGLQSWENEGKHNHVCIHVCYGQEVFTWAEGRSTLEGATLLSTH